MDKKPVVKGFDLEKKGKTLIRKPGKLNECKSIGNYRYYLFDFIPNCVLMRREVLEDYSWDDFYVIGSEHIDFYWKHKKLGKWSFAVVTGAPFYHDHSEGSVEYLENRSSDDRLSRSREYFLDKFNLDRVVTKGIGCSFPGFLRYVREFFYRKLPLPSLKIYHKVDMFLIKRLIRK